jgi:phage gp29-like protein
MLGQTATTEGTPGKLGNEDAQQEVRQDIKKADADLLSEVLNNTLVRWIVDYNFANVTEYPTLWLRTEKERDLKPLAERDKVLTADIGLKIPERYFYDTYGIPQPEGDEAVVGGPKPAPEANPSQPPFAKGRSEGNGGDGAFSEPRAQASGQRFTPDQQAIEGLADEALQDASGFLTQNEAQILAAISDAQSYEDAMLRILELYPRLDTAGIEDMISRLWLNAELFGRATTK